MPIGARIFKTGVAAGIALYIATILQLEPKILAAVSTIMNIQPSIYRSIINAKEQVFSNAIAIFIAIIFGYIFGNGPLQMTLITILIIFIISKLGYKKFIGMSVVAAIFVLDAPKEQFILHAIDRSIMIFIGIIIALVVNILIVPPNYLKELVRCLEELNIRVEKFFKYNVKNFADLKVDKDEFHEQRKKVKELLRKGRTLLELCKEQSFKDDVLKNKLEIYERYLNYNTNVYHSSRDIYVATKQRIEWRNLRGNPPILSEFDDILHMIIYGLKIYSNLNLILRETVLEEKEQFSIPDTEDFWEELGFYVEQWHSNLNGTHFLHAFMNVSIVAYDIKLAINGIQSFLEDIQQDSLIGKRRKEPT